MQKKKPKHTLEYKFFALEGQMTSKTNKYPYDASMSI